jgi:Transposase IS116/IS110/IS902 family
MATGCAACNHRCRHPSPAGHLAPAHRPPGAKTTATNQLSALLEAHWPGARPSLPVWTATSRWRSGARSDPAGRPAAGRGPPGRLPGSPPLQRPAHPSPAAAPAAGRPVAVDQLDPEVQGRLHPHPGPAAGQPAWQPHRPGSGPGRRPGEHPKATVLQPLPRIGQINLAQVLAEVGPILDRASDLSHAAAEVGATPVTKQSGKGAVVQSAGQPIPVPAMPWASSPTQPPRLSVGSPPVPASPPARQAPPPGDPHPDARLATSDLGPLAYRPALRHQPPPRRTTAGPRTRSLGLTQGTRDRCLWHASARPARATTLVRGGDGSQLAQWVRPDLR